MHWSFCKGTEVTTALSVLRLNILNTHIFLPTHNYYSFSSLSLECSFSAIQLLKPYLIFKRYFKCHLFHQIFHSLPPLPRTEFELSLLFFDIYNVPHAIIIRRQYNVMVKRFGLWNQRNQDSSPSWVTLSKFLTSVSSSIKCI